MTTSNGLRTPDDGERVGAVVQLAGQVRRAPRRRPARRRGTPSATAAAPANDSVDLGEHLVLGQHPAGPPVVGALGREDPVGDDAVDAVAEQRERRVGAAGLGEHHRLGGEHEPDAGVGPGEQGADLVELGVQPLDRVEDAAAGHRHAGRPGQHRAAAP